MTKDQMQQVLDALTAVEALIEHQYTGSSEAMNALQNAADDAHGAISIMQAAVDAPEVEPVAWMPTDAAMTALRRFEETCTDNEGYDVPKDTMRNLQAIGLIYRTYGDMYCITDFGNFMLTKDTL